MVLYGLPLLAFDFRATYETAMGYNTHDSCGNVVPARPGVGLVILLLFLPVLVSLACSFRWPPHRWWTIILWVVALAVLGAGAVLFSILSNLDLCFAS